MTEQRSRDVLPVEANVSALTLALNTGPVQATLEAFIEKQSTVDASKYFADEGNYARAINIILKNKKYFPLLNL
jgi:hypothetical protein